MFFYFSYGSNLCVPWLRAKGVKPLRSVPAVLEGFELRFNVPDFFRIDGGSANIQPSHDSAVHGVLHACRDSELAVLDRLEAHDFLYQREEVLVTGYDGQRKLAYAYLGKSAFIDDSLLPSERYRNILIRGAVDMKLDAKYIEKLRSFSTVLVPDLGPFVPARDAPNELFTLEELVGRPELTALAGIVFDMSHARVEHSYLRKVLGGKDVTLFFLQRMDTSDGTETFDDVRYDRISHAQRRYLNAYLHEFAREYQIAGQMDYDMSPPSGGFVALGAPASQRWLGSRRFTGPSSMRGSVIPKPPPVPSRQILARADALFEQNGHENMGFLSEVNGFLPREAPRRRLPPELGAWDQAAASLPDMYRSLRLRSELDKLPLLSANENVLPDEYLLRAASVLAILSHAYWYVETRPPSALPQALLMPWNQVRARLGRQGAPVLTYIDLIVYNYRLLDPARRDPLRVDNMRLLTPTVDTNEERTFYLTQTEFLARTAPVIGAAIGAQEAIGVGDHESLEGHLLTILNCLEAVVRESLLHINPNPRSHSYVDPVIWAKTVAPFAVPMKDGILGPSGTSSPIFNLLDIFLGRKRFETFLGREIQALRETYPPLWLELLEAVGSVSVSQYVEESQDPNLSGLLHEILTTYAGPNGFLGRHRMKVFGYLEIGFKVGRAVTIGGFRGAFKDRTWERVDNELEMSRLERVQSLTASCHYVRIKQVTPDDPKSANPVYDVVLDISSTGIGYEPGDRCGILPENDESLVNRTLEALGATGDEFVELSQEWADAAQLRWRYRTGTQVLPLRELLRFGRIRPVTTRTANVLYEVTRSEIVKRYIQQGLLHRLELWDLLLELRQSGFDTTSLWKDASGGVTALMCRLIQPESYRMYSIASAMSSAETGGEQELRLSVSSLAYETETAGGGPKVLRQGTASSFIARMAGQGEHVSVILHHPPRFSLPRQSRTPIVMIAGGTGLSPFRGFIAEIMRQHAAGQAWLLLGLRSREQFAHGDELLPALRTGMLKLDLAFSRDDIDLRFEEDESGVARFVEIPGARRRVQDLMLREDAARELWKMLTDGNLGACVYVCGRSGFARSVIDTIKEIFRRFAVGSEAEREASALESLCRVVAEGRLMLEIFSGHTEDDPLRDIDISELAQHNDERNGYWTVTDGKVYDLTEFIRLHPGGTRILQAYAGMSSTEGYERSHPHRSEIDAMREMYVCGRIRRLDLGDVSSVVQGPKGEKEVSLAAVHRVWAALLMLLVEMQNALRNDHSLQDGITARGDPVRPRSMYKIQRAVETHERFLRNYLDLLLHESLPNLWKVTQPLFFPGAAEDELGKRLADVQNSDAGRKAEALVHTLYGAVSRLVVEPSGTTEDGGADRGSSMAKRCEAIEELDRTLLADLKALFTRGVRLFEELGPKVQEQGAAALAEVCEALPGRVARFYEAAGAVFG